MEQTYSWVLLLAALVAFETIMIGFVAAGKVRRQVFQHSVMEEKWGEKHVNALKEAGYSERNSKLGKGGYPDCGSGLYS